MKFGVLKSIAHNAADSLGSGIGLMVGVYDMDIYGEAGQSPGGTLTVDFLTGRIIDGDASESLQRAVALYRTAFDELCAKHGVEPWSFKQTTARYGTTSKHITHFTIKVEDRDGHSATEVFVGSPGRRL